MAKSSEVGDQAEGQSRRKASVQWNKDNMATSFSNVVNIQGTREQVEIFFGVSRSFEADTEGPMEVDLSNRVILTPYGAKRLHLILTGVLREYEARHGALTVEEK